MTPLEASKKKNESTVYFNLYGGNGAIQSRQTANYSSC